MTAVGRDKAGTVEMLIDAVVNHAANITWIVSSIAGAYGGQYIPEGAFGIDYALIAMFICLLVFQ